MIGLQESSSRICPSGKNTYSFCAFLRVLRSLTEWSPRQFRCTPQWLTSGWSALTSSLTWKETCLQAESLCSKESETTTWTQCFTSNTSDLKHAFWEKLSKDEKFYKERQIKTSSFWISRMRRKKLSLAHSIPALRFSKLFSRQSRKNLQTILGFSERFGNQLLKIVALNYHLKTLWEAFMCPKKLSFFANIWR